MSATTVFGVQQGSSVGGPPKLFDTMPFRSHLHDITIAIRSYQEPDGPGFRLCGGIERVKIRGLRAIRRWKTLDDVIFRESRIRIGRRRIGIPRPPLRDLRLCRRTISFRLEIVN